jgi:hypothetical protein
MKNFLHLILALSLFAAAGCSRSEDKTTVKPQSTPDAERLKSDSERLQQATNKAAEQRKREESRTSTHRRRLETTVCDRVRAVRARKPSAPTARGQFSNAKKSGVIAACT